MKWLASLNKRAEETPGTVYVWLLIAVVIVVMIASSVKPVALTSVFLFWVGTIYICYRGARFQGRSGLLWAFLGAWLNWIAVLILANFPRRKETPTTTSI